MDLTYLFIILFFITLAYIYFRFPKSRKPIKNAISGLGDMSLKGFKKFYGIDKKKSGKQKNKKVKSRKEIIEYYPEED